MCVKNAGNATACVFNSSPEAAFRWPSLMRMTIEIGGVITTCGDALSACEILSASGACAIRAVLRAAGNPLADCDYHAVYRPGLASARAALEATGRPGGAGRHLAKHAFAAAVRRRVAERACTALGEVLASFRTDERYASAIARDAVAILSRQGHRRGSALIRDSDASAADDAIAA